MDYDKATEHWTKKDQEAVKMPAKALKVKIDAFISEHNTCALAVADGDFVRCTPIEYNYYLDKFWLFSEGGLKFRALKNNKHVCLAIYDAYEGFGRLGGMQVTGMAEIVEPWTEEYISLIEYKKLPMEVMKKLPEPMHLIKITPQEIDFLSSDLKQEGFGNRQKYIF